MKKSLINLKKKCSRKVWNPIGKAMVIISQKQSYLLLAVNNPLIKKLCFKVLILYRAVLKSNIRNRNLNPEKNSDSLILSFF